MKMIIAHGGSSSPGLYISRRGVAGAPYSGQKHPGRPASLMGAEDTNRGSTMSQIKHRRKQAKQHKHSRNLRVLRTVYLAPDSAKLYA